VPQTHVVSFQQQQQQQQQQQPCDQHARAPRHPPPPQTHRMDLSRKRDHLLCNPCPHVCAVCAAAMCRRGEFGGRVGHLAATRVAASKRVEGCNRRLVRHSC
jgi:hypothetical protein